MTTRQISFSLPTFFGVYIFQEAVMNQFRLPGGGFSLFLIFTLVWALLSSPEIAALAGFVAGLLMDLSQSSSGPIGQWTLIMIVTCFAISYLGSGNDSLSGNPFGVVFFITSGVFIVEIVYIVISALLGVQTGSFEQVLRTLIGISLWTMVVTPIILPIFSRLHSFAFDTKSAI